MSRSSFKAHAVDESGAVLTSASVTVRDQSGVVISPSALFTAYSGTGTHASNPFTATGGLISFYVEGSQVVTVSAVSGGTSQTWSNIVLNELIEPSDFATAAQGTKADSATQPADLGTAAADNKTSAAAVLWDDGNYQPETSLGLGVVRLMKNKSGGTIVDQATVAGSSLKAVFFNASNALTESSATIGGTWKNVGGSLVVDDGTREFVRIA
jgi:hypothetical protein